MIKFNMKSYIVLLFASLLFFQSCDLEDVNDDPSRPSEAGLNLLLPDAIAQAAYNQSATSARLSGIVTQQFFGSEAQQEAYTMYLIGTDVFNNMWRTGVYAGVMKSTNNIVKIAAEQGAEHYQGIAKVIMANELLFTTAQFGDIPFSNALQGTENLKPSYDSQEAIFASIDRLLSEAVAHFAASDDSGKVPGSDDLIFGGDLEKWTKYAHSLSARSLMMRSKKGSSMDAVLAAVEKGFASSADNATYTFSSAITGANPLAKFGEDRSGTLLIDPNFYRSLDANNDPRALRYVSLTVNDADTTFSYHGTPELVWAQRDASIPLMSYSELMYIKAEALARNNASADEVGAALKAGIDANVTVVTGAVNEDFSTAQSDLSGQSSDEMVQSIIESAYYSYYGHAFQQVWNNYRRTGYPALTPNANGVNAFDPSGVVPRRWLYPIGEENSNLANMQAAISAQGGHLLDNDIWLFE